MILSRPLIAALSVAVSAMPAFAAEDEIKDQSDKRSVAASAEQKGTQITLTGKVVDLHQFFTGDSSSSSGKRLGEASSEDKHSASSDKDREHVAADKDKDSKHAGGKMKQQYMGLINPMASATGVAVGRDSAAVVSVKVMSSDLIILCFADSPGIYAVPRSDDSDDIKDSKDIKDSTENKTDATEDKQSDAKTGDKDREYTASDKSKGHKGHAGKWKDQQIKVTGTLFEKNGVKFLLVNHAEKAEAGSSGSEK